ncbi:cupin domain-containing protein [Flavobacterium agricola]|uniref:Cupin domain-containing protein n=1 Tax=Flavobacterium agricola TaxID=2870839 RepID=A0ABY6M291_9FLAO|nr:cupin domain-containing protein [Flavobacterium agricola]UYW02372.1 cupin domain-containing protein [Flavobacterium agricola]
MNVASIFDHVVYGNEKPAVSVLLNTDDVKEVRIVFKKGQEMKEHKANFPIVVAVYDGAIDFGFNGERVTLEKGMMIALEGGVPHDLLAKQDSIVRLSLSKGDSIERAKKVAEG